MIDPDAQKPVIDVFAYGPDGLVEQHIDRFEDLEAMQQAWPVIWINISGLGDETILRQFAERYKFHRLALEDVVNTQQRPKVEQYDEYIFIVNRVMEYDGRLDARQVSLFLGKDYVLTFQERTGSYFEEVRNRIRAGKGLLRKCGPDYLTYALVDAIIDRNFPLLETYGEHLEALEAEVLQSPHQEIVGRIFGAKRELLAIRRAVWPLREAMNSLMRDESPFIADETRLYLRDCYDHVIQIADMLETYRELASGLMDLYLSSVGNRMNEIMKVLTLFAAIFIPLSFIAGLYGMNFDTESPFNLPELGWKYGYVFALGLMLTLALSLLAFFWHKGWIGSHAPPARSNPRSGRDTRDGPVE